MADAMENLKLSHLLGLISIIFVLWIAYQVQAPLARGWMNQSNVLFGFGNTGDKVRMKNAQPDSSVQSPNPNERGNGGPGGDNQHNFALFGMNKDGDSEFENIKTTRDEVTVQKEITKKTDEVGIMGDNRAPVENEKKQSKSEL